VIPEYQLIEKNENIAKRSFLDFVCFRSGLNNVERKKNDQNGQVISLRFLKHKTSAYKAEVLCFICNRQPSKIMEI